MLFRIELAFVVLGAALLTTACGDDGGDGPGTIDVALQFAAEVDGAAFACGQEYAVGVDDTPLEANDFRFYVHDVRLVTDDGTEVPVELEQDGTWQVDDIALLDFEDGTAGCVDFGNELLRDEVTGTAPAGEYDGVRFVVGVPFDNNHVNPTTAPSPLSFTAMNWFWLGGYKFIRFDGSYPDEDGGWFLHLGSTVCTNDAGQTFPSMDFDQATTPAQPCDNPNLMEISLDGFDPLTGTIVADIGNVLADTAVDQNDGIATGCQSAPMDSDCAEVFPRLGLAHSGNPPQEQQLFTGR